MNDKVMLIKEAIKRNIADATIYVHNPDDEHFEAIVISESFNGVTLVKQHQSVLKALKESFDSQTIHALALKTFSPATWENKKDQFNLSLLH